MTREGQWMIWQRNSKVNDGQILTTLVSGSWYCSFWLTQPQLVKHTSHSVPMCIVILYSMYTFCVQIEKPEWKWMNEWKLKKTVIFPSHFPKKDEPTQVTTICFIFWKCIVCANFSLLWERPVDRYTSCATTHYLQYYEFMTAIILLERAYYEKNWTVNLNYPSV